VNLGEYDDDFFNLMPVLFPYNRFTMTVRLRHWMRFDYNAHCLVTETHQAHHLHRPPQDSDRQTGRAAPAAGSAHEGGILKGTGGMGEERRCVGCVPSHSLRVFNNTFLLPLT
jgi:hypothetical protein